MGGLLIQLLFFGLFIYALVRISNASSSSKSATKNQSARSSSSDTRLVYDMTNQSIADQLDVWAGRPEYRKEARHYRVLAAALRAGQAPVPGAEAALSAANQARSVLEDSPVVRTIQPVSQTAATLIPLDSKLNAKSLFDTKELLRNVNVLLFVGALLVVVSVMILVGSNFEALSNGAKMILVSAGTAVFYFGGLWLYNFRKHLRPAGVTFAIIGMLMIPLTGVAYYNLFANGEAPLIWFATSAISAVAYFAASRLLRQPLLLYVFIVSLLSTFESGLYAVDAPLMMLTWASLVFAAGLLLVDRKNIATLAVTQPISTSGMVLVPLTIVASYMQVEISWELAVTFILSSLIYFEVFAFIRDTSQKNAQYYFAIANSLLVSSVFALAVDRELEFQYITIVMIILGLAYLLFSVVLKSVLAPVFTQTLWWFAQTITAISTVIGLQAFAVDLSLSFYVSILAIIFYGLSSWLSRSSRDLSLGLFAVSLIMLALASRMLFALQSIDTIFIPLFYLGMSLVFATSARALRADIFANGYTVLMLQYARVTAGIAAVSLLLYSSSITFTSITVALIGVACVYLYIHLLIARDSRQQWRLDYALFLTFTQLAVFTFGLDIDLTIGWMGFLMASSALLISGIGLLLVFTSRLAASRGRLHAPASAVVGLFAVMLCLGDPQIAAASYAIVGASQLLAFAVCKKYIHAWFALFTGLALPLLTFGYLFTSEPDTTAVLRMASYAALACAAWFWRIQYADTKAGLLLKSDAATVALVGYLSAIALFFIVSIGVSPEITIAGSMIAAIALWYASNYERLPLLQAMSAALSYVAVFLLPDTELIAVSDQASLYVVLGLTHYGIGLLLTGDQARSNIWRTSGGIATAIALLAPQPVSIIAHISLSGMIGFESYKTRNKTGLYIAAGFFALAINRLLFYVGISDAHINSLPWGLYAASVAYYHHRARRFSQRDQFIVIALSVITLPLGLQALDSGDTQKGLVLLVQSAGIMLLGMASRLRLMVTWGAAVIVVQVLYQMRSVIGAIPKQVFTLGIGMVLLGVALYYLSRTKDDS